MDRELVATLHENARTLREALGVEVNDMPIVPLIIGDPDDAMAVCEAALQRASSLRPSARRPSPRAPRGCASSPPPPTTRTTCARALAFTTLPLIKMS